MSSGGLWARPELAAGSRRKGHSEVAEKPPLPAPAAAPPYPQLQRRRALGRGGEAAESAPRCLPGVWRAEQAMALDRGTYLHPAVLPSNQLPSLNGQVTGGRGRAGVCSVIWLLLPGPGP